MKEDLKKFRSKWDLNPDLCDIGALLRLLWSVIFLLYNFLISLTREYIIFQKLDSERNSPKSKTCNTVRKANWQRAKIYKAVVDLNLGQIETVKRAAIEHVVQHTTPRTTTLPFLRQLVLRNLQKGSWNDEFDGGKYHELLFWTCHTSMRRWLDSGVN